MTKPPLKPADWLRSLAQRKSHPNGNTPASPPQPQGRWIRFQHYVWDKRRG